MADRDSANLDGVMQAHTLDLTPGGALHFTDGALTVDTLAPDAAGFAFTGGRLTADTVSGDLANQGGTLVGGGLNGITHINGSDSQDASGTLEIVLAGPAAGRRHDRVMVSDDAAFDGALSLSVSPTLSLATGRVFQIVPVGGISTGTFTGLPQDALIGTFGGTDLFISYGGGDGNDVVLFTKIPEPGMLPLLCGAVLACLSMRGQPRHRGNVT